MFFLLRMAFWLGLVLVLLPREKTPESDKLPQLGASEAVSAASAAVSDMGQFCKRQPAACEVGGQAATVIGQRAQAGARKLYQIITDKREEVSINYKLHSIDNEWKVYDLVIEDISVVNNYRSQFDRVIARSSFEELVRVMKEKQS